MVVTKNVTIEFPVSGERSIRLNVAHDKIQCAFRKAPVSLSCQPAELRLASWFGPERSARRKKEMIPYSARWPI